VKILWTKAAKSDIKLIKNYISNDSINYANFMVDRILTNISRLATFPESGRYVPEFEDNRIRELIVNPYRIIYLIKDDTVFILTIVHTKQMI